MGSRTTAGGRGAAAPWSGDSAGGGAWRHRRLAPGHSCTCPRHADPRAGWRCGARTTARCDRRAERSGPGSPGRIEHRAIHGPAPPLERQGGTREIFHTGIKVIDLLAPLIAGGKAAMFGGAGVGKTVLIMEL